MIRKIFDHSMARTRLTNSRVKTMFKNWTLLYRINETSRMNTNTATFHRLKVTRDGPKMTIHARKKELDDICKA